MEKHLRRNFELYFPSIAKNVAKYYETNDLTVVAKLNDGSMVLYDNLDNSIRSLPSDSRNMTEEECLREFGERLRRAMIFKGVSQQELAERTGIPRETINRYIRGKVSPSFYKLDKISKVLGCSINDLQYIN